MRRIVIIGVLAGVGFVVARKVAPKVGQRLMSRCEGMFEHMPDDFPPKRMMRGIEETRVKTTRILELLEARNDVRTPEPTEGARRTA